MRRGSANDAMYLLDNSHANNKADSEKDKGSVDTRLPVSANGCPEAGRTLP